MTNIVKEYTIQGFEYENSPNTLSSVVITKDCSKNPFYIIKISDGQKNTISLSASDPVIMEIAQAISDLTNGMFSPSRSQEVR